MLKGQRGASAIAELSTVEAFTAARDLLALSVPSSPAVQESGVSAIGQDEAGSP